MLRQRLVVCYSSSAGRRPSPACSWGCSKPYGPGWALVGDAGMHQDPCSAGGISNAFAHVELLVEGIDASFSGRQPVDEALADYERQRNDLTLEDYERTCQRAALQPPPAETLELRAALRGNQKDTDRYFGAGRTAASKEEFFSKENIQRTMKEAELRK